MIKNIILDPGHGGIDRDGKYTTKGKQHTFSNGQIAYEGVINRNIVRKLGYHLRMQTGLNIIYTVHPNSPEDIPLGKRVHIANQYPSGESLFISIHNNASIKPNTGTGFEIYTTRGQNNSDILAEFIYEEVVPISKQFGFPMRPDLSDGDHDKEANFFVIKGARMPAVLIEVLFFDNYSDYKLLTDNIFLNRIVEAIANGILKYVHLKKQGMERR